MALGSSVSSQGYAVLVGVDFKVNQLQARRPDHESDHGCGKKKCGTVVSILGGVRCWKAARTLFGHRHATHDRAALNYTSSAGSSASSEQAPAPGDSDEAARVPTGMSPRLLEVPTGMVLAVVRLAVRVSRHAALIFSKDFQKNDCAVTVQ